MSRAYTFIGTILYLDPVFGPQVKDVWANGPDLAASWEHTRLQYYPDYAGPPPTLLQSEIDKQIAYAERIESMP